MAPHILPFPRRSAALATEQPGRAADKTVAHHLALNAEDGTLQLLRSGFCTAGVAACALLLTLFVFGGIGVDGPRTTTGWLLLMIALMSMPFGLLMLLLGGAKWLRNHRLSRHRGIGVGWHRG